MKIKDVAGDGNCLLWAAMLSYLEEVKSNEKQFKERYAKLFGREIGWERIFNFNDFNFNNSENIKLVKTFRNRICDYIEQNLDKKRPENKADFKSMLLDSEINKKNIKSENKEKQIKTTLNEMRKNGTYTGSVEIEAICNILECNIIRVNEKQTNWIETFKPDDVKTDTEIKVDYKDGHYKYYSNITNSSEENISTTPKQNDNFLANARLIFRNEILKNKDIDEKNCNAVIDIFIKDLTNAPEDKQIEILKTSIFELNNQDKIFESFVKPKANQTKTCAQESESNTTIYQQQTPIVY